jgi:hypothetical protein
MGIWGFLAGTTYLEMRVILSHPADPILSQGGLLDFESATVDKCTHCRISPYLRCIRMARQFLALAVTVQANKSTQM